MAGITLTQARTNVRQLLDDAGTVSRWTDAQVDAALGDCISGCLNRYASEGGDRFDLETTGTTSATDGSLSLSSVSPLLIKQVAIVSGTLAYRIDPLDPVRRGYPDLVARSVRVLYVREYDISSTAGDPLVGVGAASANTWRGFDKWVCHEAACQLSGKDMEVARMQMLRVDAEKAGREALARRSTPGAYPLPRPQVVTEAFGDVRWSFVQGSTIYLARAW